MSTRLRPRAWHWVGFAVVVASGVGADQASKARAREMLPVGQLRHAAGPLFLRRAENPGIALGALPAGNVVPIAIAALIVGLLAIFVAWGRLHPVFAPGCALATAGCAGNLLDRLLHGHVTDFLALGRAPVFNLADALIVSGFALMVGSSVLVDLHEPVADDRLPPLARVIVAGSGGGE